MAPPGPPPAYAGRVPRFQVIRVPDAALAAGDPTRAFGVGTGGRVLLPGVTRPEAEDACRWLAVLRADEQPLALAEVALPVVLTDGAGPHLLDAGGALVLALAPHRGIAGARVAMGAPGPLHAVGLVRAHAGGGWGWMARAEVGDRRRVHALDALDAVRDPAGLASWARAWAGVMPASGAE